MRSILSAQTISLATPLVSPEDLRSSLGSGFSDQGRTESEHWTRKQLVTNVRIELLSAILCELGPYLRLAQRFAIRPIRGHCIDRVRE